MSGSSEPVRPIPLPRPIPESCGDCGSKINPGWSTIFRSASTGQPFCYSCARSRILTKAGLIFDRIEDIVVHREQA